MAAASRRSHVFDEAEDGKLLREFSYMANQMVQSSIGSTVSPGICTVFMLNSLTGLSLLTLPYGFAEAGLVTGSLFLFACLILSFITATFMCEALTIANALTYEKAERQVIETMPDVRAHLHQEYQAALPSKGSSEPLLPNRRGTVEAFVDEVRERHPESEFKIRERVELGQMGELVLHSKRNKFVATLIYLTIVIYTYGTATALTVTVNESLAHTAGSVLAIASPDHGWDDDSIYRLCVLASFSITLPLCFSNLQKTKSVVVVVMALRFIAIFAMLCIGTSMSVHRLREEGTKEVLSQLPMWRPTNLMAVFGNSVFLFGLHHYLPSMISPLEDQTKAPRVIFTAFFSCFVVIVLICATAMIAWGNQEHKECSPKPGGHFCQIQPLYNLNFVPLSTFGGSLAMFITAYPSLAITSIPVAAITTRNTMARWMDVYIDADSPYALKNVLMTLAVLVPPNIIAVITRDIQAVVAIVGGYAGLTVTVLCPLVLLYRFRSILNLDDSMRPMRTDRPLRSKSANAVGYSFVLAFYVVALVLETKKLFFSAVE